MIWFLLGAALALALVVTLTLWSACVVAGRIDEEQGCQILPAKAGELVPDALDETQCPASERPAV